MLFHKQAHVIKKIWILLLWTREVTCIFYVGLGANLDKS